MRLTRLILQKRKEKALKLYNEFSKRYDEKKNNAKQPDINKK